MRADKQNASHHGHDAGDGDEEGTSLLCTTMDRGAALIRARGSGCVRWLAWEPIGACNVDPESLRPACSRRGESEDN